METQQQPRQFLRLKQVEAKTGYKRSTLYLKITRNEFPKPISLGARAVAWDSCAVDAWMDSRVQASQHPDQLTAKAAQALMLAARSKAAATQRQGKAQQVRRAELQNRAPQQIQDTAMQRRQAPGGAK